MSESSNTWPPEIPPLAEPGEIPLCIDEADLADHLIGKVCLQDYRWAMDLRTWIMRDGVRWVPAPRGVAPIIAQAVAMSEPTPVLDEPIVQNWARKHPNAKGQAPVPSWGPSYDDDKKYGIDDVTRHNMIKRMRTPAAQARVAALMAGIAAKDDGIDGSIPVRTDELDNDPGILWAGSMPWDLAQSVDKPEWAKDGFYDLSDMMTQPHMMSANYCPDIRVKTPLWDELTEALFPDINEREHALNALAHGLHGYPSDTAILARSATGLGKSLLASLMSDLLGDYAGQVAAKTLFGRGGNSQFAFDEMHGARFVVMNEGKKADFASTEAFKAVVSPDPLVNSRARHERHRRLTPARHTLFLTVNPAADLDYSDPAVRRRLVPVGFAGKPVKVRKLAAKYGTNSVEGLANWQREAPGVLAQMIVRCAYVLGDYPFRGSQEDMPVSLESRFDAVYAEADPFGQWLTERTCDGLPTATDDLVADYEAWCELHQVPTMSPAWFGRALASADIERCKMDRGATRGWRIALRTA